MVCIYGEISYVDVLNYLYFILQLKKNEQIISFYKYSFHSNCCKVTGLVVESGVLLFIEMVGKVGNTRGD